LSRHKKLWVVLAAAAAIGGSLAIGLTLGGNGTTNNGHAVTTEATVPVGPRPSGHLPPAGPIPGEEAASISAVSSVRDVSLLSIAAALKVDPGTPIRKLTASVPLILNAKPEVLYIGADYSAASAVERWIIIVALSKFGVFHNLNETASASSRAGEPVPSFSFSQASYVSRFLTFVGVETATNRPAVGGVYSALRAPTPTEAALWSRYDPARSYPFIDIGNMYVVTVPGVAPSLLAGKGFAYVAARVGNNSTVIGRTIDGAAGEVLRALCRVTHEEPSPICSAVA
jgi:hypothetical protein